MYNKISNFYITRLRKVIFHKNYQVNDIIVNDSFASSNIKELVTIIWSKNSNHKTAPKLGFCEMLFLQLLIWTLAISQRNVHVSGLKHFNLFTQSCSLVVNLQNEMRLRGEFVCAVEELHKRFRSNIRALGNTTIYKFWQGLYQHHMREKEGPDMTITESKRDTDVQKHIIHLLHFETQKWSAYRAQSHCLPLWIWRAVFWQ